MKLQGIVPAVVTPLTLDETLHEEHMRRVVDHLIEHGVHALFINGSMGAFNLLTDDVQMEAIRVAVEHTAGRVPVMAGISDTSTKLVIEKGLKAKALGANYLTALPPYYARFNSTQIIRFFSQVAEAVDHPLLVYNNPYTLLSHVDVETALALSRIPNIVGIKDSSNDPAQYQQLIRHFRGASDFTYLAGSNALMTFCLMLGGDGIIEGLHNLAPAQAVALYNAARQRDWEEVERLQAKLDRLADIVHYGEVWGGVEAGLRILGLCDKITARPYISVEDQQEIGEIEGLLQEVLA